MFQSCRILGWLALCTVLIACSVDQSAPDEQFDLLAPGANLKQLAGGFSFTEGPAADRNGHVYFTDIYRSRINRWSPNGQVSTFRVNSGGANGLMFDKSGNLLACEGKARRVTSISPSGKVTVLADSYGGKKLNSPNDLWIDPKGGVYFTDPRSGNKDDLEQDGFHVYYISPQRDKIMRVIDNLVSPNGVIGTSDGKLLYVADDWGGKTYVYRINGDGSLKGRSVAARQGSDGMTLDEVGNLYLTRDDVLVYNKKGKRIATIAVPGSPSNVTFGGKDKKTLFITAGPQLYSISMNVRGQ